MTHLTPEGRAVLTGPVALVAAGSDPGIAPWKAGGPHFHQADGREPWPGRPRPEAGPLTHGHRGADGVRRQPRVHGPPRRDRDDAGGRHPAGDPHRDRRGPLPDGPRTSRAGVRPDTFEWKWEVAKNNQDSAWIGDVNAGLQFTLKDDKYVRPLNTNFYTLKPLVMPASWVNEGKGGCRLGGQRETRPTSSPATAARARWSPGRAAPLRLPAAADARSSRSTPRRSSARATSTPSSRRPTSSTPAPT